MAKLRYIDLFCGIGGFRIAGEELGWECVFSSDIDEACRKAYYENFGDFPHGDIHEVAAEDIPGHDVLVAGFPCQPFSIIGERRGFTDTRGTLFFEIVRILSHHKPRAIVLENVKQLATHNGGKTLKRIVEVLNELGYAIQHRILNALDFGLPQKRQRIIIIGARERMPFVWPQGGVPMRPLSEILESDVPAKHFASAQIRQKRKLAHRSLYKPSIWHENKAGNVSSHPYSCALRAGASYNYLLVDGVRRLTPREMLRLQGFPDEYRIVCNDAQTRKQAGNSVPIPVVAAVMAELDRALRDSDGSIRRSTHKSIRYVVQESFLNATTSTANR